MFSEHGLYPKASDILPLFDLTGCVYERNLEDSATFKASEYLFIYLLKGNGELLLNNKKQKLNSGDFIVCRPFESKVFVPLDKEGCEYYAVAFNGRHCTDLLTNLNLIPKKNYFIGRDGEVVSFLERICKEYQKVDLTSLLVSSSLFVATLGIISRLSISVVSKSGDKGYEKIAPALTAINSDCTSKMAVDEYAKMCNLSASYFTHLFTKVTGFSPMEYKQLQRISIAKNLLSTTNLSIKEISTIIGFKDPLYFGRCFKQSTGYTPTEYRNKK